jgi:hypothetical protein
MPLPHRDFFPEGSLRFFTVAAYIAQPLGPRNRATFLQRLSFDLREAGPDPSDAQFEIALQRGP